MRKIRTDSWDFSWAKRVLLFVVLVGLAVPVIAQEKRPDAFLVHPEGFLAAGYAFRQNSLDPASGEIRSGKFTLAMTLQFAPGKHYWVECDPGSDSECTEKSAPRVAFSGIGPAMSDYGGMGVQFPLVTIRTVRNAWLSAAVNVWPWARPGVSHASFTVSFALAFARRHTGP